MDESTFWPVYSCESIGLLIMLAIPQPDAFGGVVILAILGLGAITLLAVILLEAIVLRRLGWASLGRCLVDSTVMNLASALIGFLLAWVLSIDFTQIQSTGLLLLLLLLGYALSVLVEGGVIALLRRIPLREMLKPIALANVASYALLMFLVFVSNIRRF